MSIDKIQEIEKVIRNNASALICPKCGGGGTGAYKGEGQKRCQECNGEGLVDWDYGDAPEKISDLISQAEARGRESERERILEAIQPAVDDFMEAANVLVRNKKMESAKEIRENIQYIVSTIRQEKRDLDLLTKLKEDK